MCFRYSSHSDLLLWELPCPPVWAPPPSGVPKLPFVKGLISTGLVHPGWCSQKLFCQVHTFWFVLVPDPPLWFVAAVAELAYTSAITTGISRPEAFVERHGTDAMPPT